FCSFLIATTPASTLTLSLHDALPISDLAQEFTSTARFGTSMSARRILGLESVPRVGLFAHESGTRAGFRTSRDSSVSIRRGRRKIASRHLQYERTEMARPLGRQLVCADHR